MHCKREKELIRIQSIIIHSLINIQNVFYYFHIIIEYSIFDTMSKI